MKHKRLFVSMLLFTGTLIVASRANGQQILTGDTRLACEAILCLSSSLRPSECTPSLRRYFGISMRRLSDTIRARANFLKLCPMSDQTPQMSSLVNAIASGAGRCDAEALNATLRSWNGEKVFINNQVPEYCAVITAKYVGTPERGGYWVEVSDYERAIAEYKARIVAEDAQRVANPTSN